MSEFPSLPLWTDAYMLDCGHLSDAEHGRYLLLLMLIWRSPDCRVPNNAEWIGRKLARTPENYQTEIAPLVAEFCKNDGNWITQKRLSKEYIYLQKQSRRQRASANARWQKGKVLSRGNATPMPNGCHSDAPTPTPTPTVEIPKGILSETSSDAPKRKRISYPQDLEAFWQAYPTDPLMSKKETATAWARLSPEDRHLAMKAVPAFAEHCSKTVDYRPLHACRFLSQRRFEGFANGAKMESPAFANLPTMKALEEKYGWKPGQKAS